MPETPTPSPELHDALKPELGKEDQTLPILPYRHPLEREPLQELPITAGGVIVRPRAPIWRPFPELDIENRYAMADAMSARRQALHQVMRLQRINTPRHQRGAFVHFVRRIRAATRFLRGDNRADNSVAAIANDPDNPRLSMPQQPDSDEGDSELDLSILGIRGPRRPVQHREADLSYDDVEDDEIISQDQYDEADETDVDSDRAEEIEALPLIDPATAGLKEISNLGKFTVSSHKPGNGVEELRSDDLKRFWQSDGPQPHRLTVYFVKRVGIRDIRFYVDYNEDESYTPTKIIFKSGTSENNLIEFATMTLDSPVGWQQVPLAGTGGDPDGNTLVSYVLQMQILENHQNGKDTHLRGIKIYAFDQDSAQGVGRESNPIDEMVDDIEDEEHSMENGGGTRYEPGEGGLTIPDFMREPEIR